MQFELEDLAYQKQAVQAVISLLDGQCVTSYDRPALSDVNANICDLSDTQLLQNKSAILKENGLEEDLACLSDERQICIEMETGTGKTLVYVQTIYELFKKYGHTKFMIVVPSVAIKEGIKDTLRSFQKPLKDRYGHTIHYFEYDSKHLNKLVHFMRDNNPQIMLTTIQAFTAQDRILNQTERDDNIDGKSYLESLGDTRPIIIMDEPQEGMDTDLAQTRLATLNPLLVLRYSATHRHIVNRLYRLTPARAYKEGMVKKIEVLAVAEKNDEATLKIEFTEVQTKAGQNPKAKLMLWHNTASGLKFKESRWLKDGDNLAQVTNNVSYQDYTIERISKGLRDKTWKLEAGGITFLEKQKQGDVEGLFRIQLHWLIRTHFDKQAKLTEKGIKCLSLIFIDKVDNFLGSDPLIKNLFAEEYQKVYQEYQGKPVSAADIEALQGYYFARTNGGDFTDNETSMKKNKAIYDLILKDKQTLLSFDNPVEFIFSHSALGVGWDNPNVFNIATLNQSYSEIKKRQELGRGLRICVNQQGKRIYDPQSVNSDDEINLLTVIPNETYATFAQQYQAQIEEDMGNKADGSPLRDNPASNRDKAKHIIKRQDKHYHSEAFKAFWQKLAQKTDFMVDFDETEIINRAAAALNALKIPDYAAEISLTRIHDMAAIEDTGAEELGRETQSLKARFSAMDLIEVLSEETSLSYAIVLQIVQKLINLDQLVKNPPFYIQQASQTLKTIELDEMYRKTSYRLNGNSYSEKLDAQIKTAMEVEPTPHKGVYDHAICDAGSNPEHNFAREADKDFQVVCFLKLPSCYKIPTPIGNYTPDFGLVLQRKGLKDKTAKDYWFVIETKGTNDLDDNENLRENERAKIKYAQKHFKALGINSLGLDDIHYIAPVKDYQAGFTNIVNNKIDTSSA